MEPGNEARFSGIVITDGYGRLPVVTVGQVDRLLQGVTVDCIIPQVSEAFRSQQLSLQQELSQQQQQQLIQSLLLRQLHLQQVGQRKESSAEESATSPTQAPPQRTLAGLLKEGERATAAELQAKSSALQAKNSLQTKNGSPEVNNGSPKVSNRSAQNVTQPPLQQQNQPIPTAPPTAQLPSQLPAQVAPQPIQLPSHHPLPPTDPRELPSPQPQPMVTQQARHISQGGIAAVVTAVNPSLTDKKVCYGCDTKCTKPVCSTEMESC